MEKESYKTKARPKMTTEEFFDRWFITRLLKQNLQANMDAIVGDKLSQELKDLLMRTNLLVIRQCLQDFGIDE